MSEPAVPGAQPACGAIAAEGLAAAQAGRVMGVTSRGVFVRLDAGWVVFLSGEDWRGPLTINIGPLLERLQPLERGAAVQIGPERLVFPALAFSLKWKELPLWAALQPAGPVLPPAARRAVGQALVRAVQSYQRSSAVLGLLPAVWGMAAAASGAGPTGARTGGEPAGDALPAGRTGGDAELLPSSLCDPRLLDWCAQARRARQARDVAGLAAALAGFVGLGSGLTPSGDDLIMGFLLALSRWGDVLWPDWTADERQALCAGLVTQVQRSSSALCGSLAACAGRGQADERLVLALGGLLTGQPAAAVCAAALAGWGSTSGFDALVGMGLAQPD